MSYAGRKAYLRCKWADVTFWTRKTDLWIAKGFGNFWDELAVPDHRPTIN